MEAKMKGVLLAALLLLPTTLSAYEVPDNPDRKISIGVNYDRYDLGGDYELGAFKATDAGTLIQNNFRADIRLPLSSFFTLSVGGGYSTQSLGLFIVHRDERWNMKGYNLNAGLRLYIP